MAIIVKNKNEITIANVHRFQESWREAWKEWVVIDDSIVFDSFETEDEANHVAELLRKAHKVRDDIQDYADEKLETLSPEEKEFFRKFAGRTLEIEV